MARPGLAPEDLMKCAWLEQIAITPAGDRIAYTVRRPRGNAYQADAYIYHRDSTHTVCCTRSDGLAAHLAWRRDGAQLALAWQAGEASEILVVDAAGQSRHVLPLPPGTAPTGLDWSPDGRWLAFSGWRRPDPAPETPAGPSARPAAHVKVIRRLRYKRDGVGWVHDRYRHIWLLDVATGERRRLTSGEMDFDQPRWSWGGDRIACVATAREQATPFGYGQIVIVDVAGGRQAPLLADWPGAAVSPQWRHDDSALVFAGHRFPPPVHRRRFHQVWRYDMAAGEAQNLSSAIDQTVGNYAVSDQRAGLTNVTVQWPGGRGPIYFLLTEQGATNLYSVDEAGGPRREIGGERVIFQFAASENGDVAFGRAEPGSIGELFYRDHARPDDVPEQLTTLNPWLPTRALATPEAYWYEGLDGTRVHAWEVKPIDFDDAGHYPAVVYVHCSMFSWDFNFEFQCLANAGYLVYFFNQRGTTAGYGQAHALGNYYGHQAAEFAEIMLGVDELSRRPYVDAARLGVTGGSCGGFLTNWIVGHTDRFAAAVTQRSVTELVSKFGTSDNGPEQAVSEGGGTPWSDGLHLWRSSPIATATRANTPVLIIHSEEDHRCALSQAEALFAALRWLGKEVELVIFEGESHGLAHSGRPGNRIERMRRISAWFDRYLN